MQAKITKRLVDGLRPGPADVVIRDVELPGFILRVRKTGGMSYAVEYKAGKGRGAPTRRVTIGAVGRIAPEEARTEARKLFARVTQGEDPASAKAEERRALTLAQVAEAYLRDHVDAKRKGSTAAWVRDALERIVVPVLGKTRAGKVTRQDVARLHSSMSDRPTQANRTLSILSALYGWAGKHGYVAEGFNPARGVEKFPEKARERFLTSEEFGRLADALRRAETVGLPWEVDEAKATAKHAPKAENRLRGLDPFAVAAIRLLLLTGARLREVLHARWDWVDFERGVLRLPDSKTGAKPVYLSAAAQRLLDKLPQLDGNPFLFPGDKEGQPRADLKKPWAAVTKAARLEGLRVHDLRHSFASVGAGGGLGLPIIGKLLGHKQPSTTARYAHLDADPMRRAVDAIGATIAAAMDENAGADVVPLRRAKG
ncbi:tyrosine-type recombinase/integrase [Methylocella sp.]|uniref:tyrosine-type recombinase/integrase n=1 Tax=Methylocella sp. TaxID=1978226 RepID=UPI003783DC39